MILFVLLISVASALQYPLNVNYTIPTHDEVLFERVKVSPSYIMSPFDNVKSFGGGVRPGVTSSCGFDYFDYNCTYSPAKNRFVCSPVPSLFGGMDISKYIIRATMWCETFEGDRIILTQRVDIDSFIVADSCRVIIDSVTSTLPPSTTSQAMQAIWVTAASVAVIIVCICLCP